MASVPMLVQPTSVIARQDILELIVKPPHVPANRVLILVLVRLSEVPFRVLVRLDFYNQSVEQLYAMASVHQMVYVL